jgi:putative flippase GtrA
VQDISRVGWAHPAARFALVGLTNFVVSFTVFYLSYNFLPAGLQRLAPQAATANVLAWLAGMVNSFILNRSWTFRASGNPAPQALRFAVVNMANLGLSTLLMYRFVDVMRLPELAVWVPTTVLVMILNYLGAKHWAFAPLASGRRP